jgi:hypothetical protein
MADCAKRLNQLLVGTDAYHKSLIEARIKAIFA